jgi:predicted amidohydrolase
MLILTNIHPEPPKAGTGLRFAAYQGVAEVAKLDHNAKIMIEQAAFAKERFGAHVIAFPELFLSGYSLNPTLVAQVAEPVDGPHLTQVAEAAKTHGIAIVCPYPELGEEHGETHYYDSIAFFGPDGALLFNYRKTQLFGQAERNNFAPGYGPYEHAAINDFPVGILNCYEAEFPELNRIQALKGAKFIIIPTAADHYYTLPNGKRTKVPYPDVSQTLVPANAYMNEVFIAYCNHVNYEEVASKSWHFRGNSVLANPHGQLSLSAPHEQECLLVGDVVPADFEPTHPEGDYLKDRRPGLYQVLVMEKPGFDDGYTYAG